MIGVVRRRYALDRLAELAEDQAGYVTRAQAAAVGVDDLSLGRLVEGGDLIRVDHGVYRLRGAPAHEFEDLWVAWLRLDPAPIWIRNTSSPIAMAKAPNRPIATWVGRQPKDWMPQLTSVGQTVPPSSKRGLRLTARNAPAGTSALASSTCCSTSASRSARRPACSAAASHGRGERCPEPNRTSAS